MKHAPLSGHRVCIACQQAYPITMFAGRGSKTCKRCRDARDAKVQARAAPKSPPYTAPELRAPVRPGALDAYALPTRHMGKRYYPDGRVEPVE